MIAVQIVQPNKIIMKEMDTPEPCPDEVLIKIMASGICGTDIHILHGEYLGSYPVVPGHEFSGLIEKTGAEITRFKPGDRVAVEPNIACDNCTSCLSNRHNFCLNWQGIGVTRAGGMAQYVTAPEKAVFSIDNLSFEEGTFIEPLSCVLHGLERMRVPAGAKIAIIGAGPIGLLLLKTVRALGAAELTVAEKNASRLDFAVSAGDGSYYVSSIDELKRDFYDAVIDATGSTTAMAKSILFARPGGTVLLFGVPPSGKLMEIEPFIIFRKGLTVLSSYTSVRNSYQAIQLMQSGRVLVRDIVSHRLPLMDFQRGIEIIERGEDNVKKVLMIPNGGAT